MLVFAAAAQAHGWACLPSPPGRAHGGSATRSFSARMARHKRVQHGFVAVQEKAALRDDAAPIAHSAVTTMPGPASPPMASIETVNSRATATLPWRRRVRSSSWPSRLRGRHNGRRSRRHDADAWARRNSGIRHGRRASGRDASGACCGATARFFVLGTAMAGNSFKGPADEIARAETGGVGSRKAGPDSSQKPAPRRGH